MRIFLDLAKCDGFASCIMTAPDVFDFDEESNRAVLIEPNPVDALKNQVEEAIRACPARAISVTT